MVVISHAKLQTNVSMFVSSWKWLSGIKDGALPSPAVLWIVSVCEENPDRKKKTKKNKIRVRKFLGLIPTFVEVTGSKTGRGNLFAPNQSWIGLKTVVFVTLVLPYFIVFTEVFHWPLHQDIISTSVYELCNGDWKLNCLQLNSV